MLWCPLALFLCRCGSSESSNGEAKRYSEGESERDDFRGNRVVDLRGQRIQQATSCSTMVHLR